MILLWKTNANRYHNLGTEITEENADNHQHAEAIFGKFKLFIHCGRQYKDGTHEYLSCVDTSFGRGVHVHTLVRTRGNLLDAINACEKALFKEYNDPRMYRLPLECVDAEPAVKKLLERHPMCFECMSETCAFNPEGVCMYPVVYGKAPDLESADGCSGWVAKREE